MRELRRLVWCDLAVAALAACFLAGDPQPAQARSQEIGADAADRVLAERLGCKPPRGPRRTRVPPRRFVEAPSATLQAALDQPISSWTRTIADPAHSTLRVQNTGAAVAQVEWVSLNGYTVFASFAEIQQEIGAIPPEADGSDATRVFRFVTDNRGHEQPITTAFEWLLTPTLFFNSVGFALCGEAAEEVNMLAWDRGLSGREWRLTGHIVGEIEVAGRWQMYDADYGVYFLDHEGRIASVAQLELDPSLITDPVLRLETPGPWSPYTAGYASLFASPDNSIRRVAPRATLPPRPLLVSLPRGASLLFPGRFAAPPLDYRGDPVDDVDYADLVLRLPAGSSGEIANPFVVHALRGSGYVRVGGQVFEIGSAALQEEIDARTDPLETIELLEAQTAIEVIYLLNPLRWRLAPTTTLRLRKSAGASLAVTVKSIGDPNGDSDSDLVADDGDASGIVGDALCEDGVSAACDDNCLVGSNAQQLDADRDGAGNACDGDFDQDELITSADLATLTGCVAGTGPPDDPGCSESDLNEDGRVDALDRAAFDRLRGVPATGFGCGVGPELVPVLALLGLRRGRCGRRTAHR
jgi:hypothetical protein